MFEINLTAPITPDTSYGVVGINLSKALNQLGNNIYLHPLGGPQNAQFETQADLDEVGPMIGQGQFYNPEAPSVKIWHQFDLAAHVGKGLHIGFPIFELNRFNPVELHHLKSQDRVFVTCNWAKGVVLQNVPSAKVSVVPLGVNTDIFKPEASNHEPTRFLNIGKWEMRKGHDVLLEAFNRAFTKKDNVQLVLQPNNFHVTTARPQIAQQWTQLYQSSPLVDKIVIESRKQTSAGVAKLINSCDVFVAPSRAEGWNLPALEAMACGKHIITTNYSAHTEYCNSENATLIEITRTEPANDGVWFQGQGDWGVVGSTQKDQLVEHLRAYHKLKQEGNLQVNTAGVETAKNFTWTNSASKLITALCE
jgi:glycosyltransferase involved in cell wall biosynthesis